MSFKKLEAREYTIAEVMDWDDPEWLVEGFVEEHSCIFISSQPKVGKSFFALRLGAAVSSGTDLFGYETKQGSVLYLAAERASLMKRRIRALQKRDVPIDSEHFKLWPDPVIFSDHTAVCNFARSLKASPDLLIIDTLRRCNDGNESDNNHMSTWTKGVESFRDMTGASVVVVHHDHRQSYTSYGKQLESSFSGAGAILGNLDGYFSVRPQTNGTIVLSSEGSNELNAFHVTTRIENVELGDDRRTGIMVEVDDDGVIEEKPDLWPLLRDVLEQNPDICMTRWTAIAKNDPRIKPWWPKLNRSSISNAVREHPQEVTITPDGNQKFCRLSEQSLSNLVVV
jgi:hypothetical protein